MLYYYNPGVVADSSLVIVDLVVGLLELITVHKQTPECTANLLTDD